LKRLEAYSVMFPPAKYLTHHAIGIWQKKKAYPN